MDLTSTISTLPSGVQVLLICGLFWLLNKLWDQKMAKGKDQDSQLSQLTIAMVELKVEVKNMSQILSLLPKLVQDSNAAHDKIRSLENRLDGKGNNGA